MSELLRRDVPVHPDTTDLAHHDYVDHPGPGPTASCGTPRAPSEGSPTRPDLRYHGAPSAGQAPRVTPLTEGVRKVVDQEWKNESPLEGVRKSLKTIVDFHPVLTPELDAFLVKTK